MKHSVALQTLWAVRTVAFLELQTPETRSRGPEPHRAARLPTHSQIQRQSLYSSRKWGRSLRGQYGTCKSMVSLLVMGWRFAVWVVPCSVGRAAPYCCTLIVLVSPHVAATEHPYCLWWWQAAACHRNWTFDVDASFVCIFFCLGTACPSQWSWVQEQSYTTARSPILHGFNSVVWPS